jgi:hypothetical protein
MCTHGESVVAQPIIPPARASGETSDASCVASGRIAPNASTVNSDPVERSSTPMDIGLSNSGGATAVRVRSPTWMSSPGRMACTLSIGTGHHVDMRSAANPWVTERRDWRALHDPLNAPSVVGIVVREPHPLEGREIDDRTDRVHELVGVDTHAAVDENRFLGHDQVGVDGQDTHPRQGQIRGKNVHVGRTLVRAVHGSLRRRRSLALQKLGATASLSTRALVLRASGIFPAVPSLAKIIRSPGLSPSGRPRPVRQGQ